MNYPLKKIAIICIGVLLVGIGGTMLWHKDGAVDTMGLKLVNSSPEDGPLPFEDPEKVEEELQRRVSESMLAIKINANPVFSNGESDGNLFIENPIENQYLVQVEIYLEDQSEPIYTSPPLKPNQHIGYDKLAVALPKGQYDATAMFNAYHQETKELAGQVAAGIKIKINQ